MNLTNAMYLVKRKILNKYNIFLCLFLTVLLIILFLAITIYNFYIEGINNILNIDPGFRTFNINKENINMNELKSIPHVISVIQVKKDYAIQMEYKASIFAKNGLDGYTAIKYITTDKDIESTNNVKIDANSKGIMVCPEKLYPDLSITEDIINYKNILNGKDYINQKLIIEDMEFTIVDTYNSDAYYETKNTCYISISDYNVLTNKMSTRNDVSTYLKVDNVKNNQEVLKILDEKNYNYSATSMIDYSVTAPIRKIMLMIIIVIPLLLINIIYFILAKKNNYNKRNYTLLLQLGYHNKDIIKISVLELTSLFSVVSIFSFALYWFLFIILKYQIFSSAMIWSSGLSIPLFFIFISIFFIFIYSLTINKYQIKRSMKNVNN